MRRSLSLLRQRVGCVAFGYDEYAILQQSNYLAALLFKCYSGDNHPHGLSCLDYSSNGLRPDKFDSDVINGKRTNKSQLLHSRHFGYFTFCFSFFRQGTNYLTKLNACHEHDHWSRLSAVLN